MKSLKTIIDKAEQQLGAIAENPRREVRLLAAHVLRLSYEDIYFNEGRSLKDEEEHLFNTLLERRLKHEPLSKILEFREFWSLPFRVTKDTLDPRPDSETLIEAVIAHYPNKEDPLRILDFGTGTGCLLLSLMHEYPNAWGVGIDISAAACYIAQENAIRLRLERRAKFIVGQWGNALSGGFDIIISNPPYISPLEPLPPEVSAYDPELALYAGEDGLRGYRELAGQIPRLATPKTKIFLELGRGQLDSVRILFSQYFLLQINKDLTGIDRCLVFCM
jgi:release factor glutamine methyltransferase